MIINISVLKIITIFFVYTIISRMFVSKCLFLMNIIIDIQEMEVLHVIVKSGPSPRPLAWSLEASTTSEGDDWRMLRTFGDKELCRRLWSLQPERRRRRVRRAKRKRTHRADKVTCSTQFSSPKPLENGEVCICTIT